MAFKAQGDDRYNQYLAYREHEVKLREKEQKHIEIYYEMKKRFPKHLYESDAEQSDYDIEERDLHP